MDLRTLAKIQSVSLSYIWKFEYINNQLEDGSKSLFNDNWKPTVTKVGPIAVVSIEVKWDFAIDLYGSRKGL